MGPGEEKDLASVAEVAALVEDEVEVEVVEVAVGTVTTATRSPRIVGTRHHPPLQR